MKSRSHSGFAASRGRVRLLATVTAAGLLAVSLAPALASTHADAKVKLPDKLTTPTGNFITLEAFDGPSSSNKVASADVQVCTSSHTPKGTGVDPYFFTLRLTSRATLAISRTAAKKPTLPFAPLGPNKCLSGWISFAVPAGATPSALVDT